MRHKLSFIRLCTDRARGYIGYVNFLMIFLIFSENNETLNTWRTGNEIVFLPIALAVFMLLLFVVGYADIRLGIFKSDLKVRSQQDPILTEILERLRRIDKELPPR